MAFGVCCDTFFERKIEPDHRLGTQNFWRDTFALKQYPALRDKPVHEIIRDDAVLALEPRPPKTKIRVQWALASVWDWAKKQGYCSGDNPFRFDLTDKFVMGDTDTVKHCESMPFEQIPAFLAKLRQYPAMGSLCLQFNILTACRPDEARGLRWSGHRLRIG